MPIRAILAAIFVSISFGVNYTATKFALMDFSPYFMLMLRFMLVSVLLFPLARHYPRPPLRQMGAIAALLLVLQFSCGFMALDLGLSITSAVIAAQLGVPFACVLAAILFKDYLGVWRTTGLVVAFVGVVIVAGTPDASGHWFAFLLAIIGSFGAGAASVYLKGLKPAPALVPLLFWPALLATPVFALMSLVAESGQWVAVTHASWHSWAGLSYSVLVTSLLGHTLWNWLVTRYPISQVVPYSLLIPVMGITAGAMAFDDAITPQVLLGAFLTIAGVVVITLRRPQLVKAEQA